MLVYGVRWIIPLTVALSACSTEPPQPAVELCESGLRCVAGDVWRCDDDGFLVKEQPCNAADEVCAEGACVPRTVSLVEPTAWQVAEAAADPFWQARPPNTEPCVEFWTDVEDSAPIIDGTWFKVETAKCNYLTAAQPLLEAVKEGDSLEVMMHHYPIIFGEGPYTLAVQIGAGPVAWMRTTPAVPLGQTWIQETFTAPSEAPAGTPIYWHVQNHGKNEWALYDIRKKH